MNGELFLHRNVESQHVKLINYVYTIDNLEMIIEIARICNREFQHQIFILTSCRATNFGRLNFRLGILQIIYCDGQHLDNKSFQTNLELEETFLQLVSWTHTFLNFTLTRSLLPLSFLFCLNVSLRLDVDTKTEIRETILLLQPVRLLKITISERDGERNN